MNRSMISQVATAMVLGVIVLPQPNRAILLEHSLSNSLGVESAHIVADAAERFSEVNQGAYPWGVSAFTKFLPGSTLLMNGVTQQRTEPIDGSAAWGGSIGYTPIVLAGINVGFTISLFGRDATVGPEGDGILLYIIRQPGPESPE